MYQITQSKDIFFFPRLLIWLKLSEQLLIGPNGEIVLSTFHCVVYCLVHMSLKKIIPFKWYSTYAQTTIHLLLRTHLETSTYHINPPQSVTNTHKSFTHSLSSCHTLRVSDPYCAIKFISLLQIDSLIYSVFFCGILKNNRKHSVITLYGFVPHQQWRHHIETACLCYLEQRSAYFISTVYSENDCF